MLSSIGSHFPRSVFAEECLIELLEFDGHCIVVEVLGNDHLIKCNEDLVDEVLEELIASFENVDGGLSGLFI